MLRRESAREAQRRAELEKEKEKEAAEGKKKAQQHKQQQQAQAAQAQQKREYKYVSDRKLAALMKLNYLHALAAPGETVGTYAAQRSARDAMHAHRRAGSRTSFLPSWH